MAKETAASYKLDFKFKKGELHFPISDFTRNSRYWSTYSNFDRHVIQLLNIEQEELNRIGKVEACRRIDEHELTKEAEAAFQKWLNRREPVKFAWDEYLAYMSRPDLNYWEKVDGTPAIGTPITLQYIANLTRNVRFRSYLETSRPYALPVGSVVKLMDKYKNSWRYDPYYWGEHRNSPRVGTIVKYSDNVTGKGGTGSRLLEVMFFADGTKKEIPERGLELYDPNKTEENK